MDKYEIVKLQIERSIQRKEAERDKLERELFDELEEYVEVTRDLQTAKVIRLKQDIGIGLSNTDYELLAKYDI